jgi:hypothetical protein
MDRVYENWKGLGNGNSGQIKAAGLAINDQPGDRCGLEKYLFSEVLMAYYIFVFLENKKVIASYESRHKPREEEW